MATNKKSIIEEALLEAKSLEDALKANTKEMLATHMKQEIENIVESSLKEQEDEEVIDDIEIGSDEEEELPVGDIDVADLEGIETGDGSVDIDLDALVATDDGETGLELDLTDIDTGDGEEIEYDDEEEFSDDELDLTGASDDEVIAVFKKMGDEDEVEVVKDEDGIHLTDNEAGTEYYIKESEELDEDGVCEGCGDVDEDEELVYEIELDEEANWGGNKDEYKRRAGHKIGDKDGHYKDFELDEEANWGGNKDEYKRRGGHKIGDKDGHYKDFEIDEEAKWGGNKDEYKRRAGHKIGDKDGHYKDFELDEDRIQSHQYPRKSGAKVGSDQASPYGSYGGSRYSESRKRRKPLSERRKPKNVKEVSDSKIVKEYKELKAKNEEYKGALKVFKNKLNEVALFNTNLAYVNRLFTEHSTTKKEKMQILKRFDGAESIKESKSIYKTVKGELDTKSPITESVENKVNKTVKSSKSDLNEATAYVDPQIQAIKDLMKKIS